MKNPLKEYLAYLKDNPEGYWFKQRAFGFGWVPATREGWAITILFILLIIGNALRLDPGVNQDPETVRTLILQTTALVVLLLIIAFKTGEKPKWHWGIPRRKEKKHEENHRT